MKLDSRIIEGRKPLTCFDAEEAKQFIGKEGYFAGDLSVYQKLDYFQTWTLQEIKNNISRCFKDNVLNEHWNYFLPKEWVQEPKPKWRAFKDHAEYKEFLNDGIIEPWVKIKDKSADKIYELMYVGGGDDKICLGGMMFSVSTLFNTFELFNESTGQWQPFGVEE
jgi:hypothetical protein